MERAKKHGFVPTTDFKDGILKTIECPTLCKCCATPRQKTLKILRKLFTAYNFQPGKFWVITWTHTFHDPATTGVCEIHRAGNGVTNTLKAGSIGDKRLTMPIKMVPPRITPTTVLNTCLLSVRSKPHDTTAL